MWVRVPPRVVHLLRLIHWIPSVFPQDLRNAAGDRLLSFVAFSSASAILSASRSSSQFICQHPPLNLSSLIHVSEHLFCLVFGSRDVGANPRFSDARSGFASACGEPTPLGSSSAAFPLRPRTSLFGLRLLSPLQSRTVSVKEAEVSRSPRRSCPPNCSRDCGSTRQFNGLCGVAVGVIGSNGR